MSTRVLYNGEGGRVLTGRTMGWKTELDTDLLGIPKGC